MKKENKKNLCFTDGPLQTVILEKFYLFFLHDVFPAVFLLPYIYFIMSQKFKKLSE